MTEIRFHFNVPSRTDYACRLLRKAWRQAAPVAVTGPPERLAELDQALWALGPTEFVAHAWVRDAEAVPASLHRAVVWLAPDALGAPLHETLLNLGDVAPAGFQSYERLIELVSTDEHDRAAARERWRGYAGRGYAIARHEVSA